MVEAATSQPSLCYGDLLAQLRLLSSSGESDACAQSRQGKEAKVERFALMASGHWHGSLPDDLSGVRVIRDIIDI